jgi:hypothetical protein
MDKFVCSASSLNTFISDPREFILKHRFGLRTEFNHWGMRGTAIENGVDYYYTEPDKVDCYKKEALKKYIRLTFDIDEDLSEYEELIEPWTETACKALSKYTSHISYDIPKMQEKISFNIDGLDFIGYLDYHYGEEVLDLKTVKVLPKIGVRGDREGRLLKKEAAKIRQQCLYKYATGLENKLVFVTPTEHMLYEISEEEYEETMEEIFVYIKELKTLLNMPLDKAVDKYRSNKPHGFFWTSSMKDKASELWD